jgi:hypothetical protein
MQRHGIGERVLSRTAGLNERAVGQMLTRTDNPGVESLASVARVLGVSVGFLYDGEARERQIVRIVGAVSAGEEWAVFDDEIDELPMSVEGGDPIGLEVRGDSMAPVCRNGDILIGGKKATNLQDLLGTDCILALADNRRFVKYLARGRLRGRYNLRSYNPAYPDIENVEVEWAAPISWICRRHPR